MLIRRVVPAMVATLAVYAGLAFAAGLFLRQHYLTPLVTRNLNVPASAWIISQWWTKGGKFAFAGFPPTSLLNQFCPSSPSGPGNFKPSAGTLAQSSRSASPSPPCLPAQTTPRTPRSSSCATRWPCSSAR
jgi:hypothetical protein